MESAVCEMVAILYRLQCVKDIKKLQLKCIKSHQYVINMLVTEREVRNAQ